MTESTVTPRRTPRSSFGSWAAPLLVVAIVAWSAWRAAQQSLTHDESWTWTQFASGGPWDIFGRYAPNNHVLHSLLMWGSARLFGPHEFSLRLPALLGGVLCLAALLRLSRRWFHHGGLALLFFSALALNPLFLDYFVQARGYSLMLAGLAWGAWWLSASVEGRAFAPRRAVRGSVAVGLALATVPSCAFAAVGLGGATAARALRRGGRLLPVLGAVALPGLAIAGAILGAPLLHANPAQFHFGASSPWSTALGIASASLTHLPPPYGSLSGTMEILVPPVAAVLLGAAFLLVIAGLGELFGRARPARFFAAAFTLQVVAVALGVWAFELPWPRERTALDLMMMGTLGLGEAWAVAGRSSLRTMAAWILAGILVANLVQIEGRRFRSHPYDAASREVYDTLAAEAAALDHGPVSVWAEARLGRALEAYRRLRGDEGLMNRIILGWKAPDRRYDFYVLTVEQAERMGRATPLGALDRVFQEVGRFDGGRILVVRPR